LAPLLSSQLEEERRACQLQREARAAAIYPSLIAGLFLLVFCGLIGMLARPITDIMHEFELALPWSTQLLSDLSDHGATVALAVAGGALALWLLLWFVLPRSRTHAALKLIPFYGPLWRYTTLARWSRTMAQLVDAEVALPEAIRLAGDATDDADLASASREAALDLERGAPLALALGGASAFPRWLGSTLAWGVNQHQLTSALLAAGDAFAACARRQISLIGVAMPAIAFLIVIWGATFLFSAAFAPMLKLIETLT
jgi:type II secretory pathway component PulF